MALISLPAWSQDFTAQQIWGNAIFSFPESEKLYWELDVEPKLQISGNEQWQNIDVTPLLEYYPNHWIDLTAEMTSGYTDQSDDINTVEITPRLGIRLHFIKNVWQYLDTSERVPLNRLSLATLLRLEARNLWYNDNSSEHVLRLRFRFETKIAINRARLDYDRTIYCFTDVEYYIPIEKEVSERYASKFRLRIGPGYRLTFANRFELLFIYDFARNTLDEGVSKDAMAVNFRFKFYFN